MHRDRLGILDVASLGDNCQLVLSGGQGLEVKLSVRGGGSVGTFAIAGKADVSTRDRRACRVVHDSLPGRNGRLFLCIQEQTERKPRRQTDVPDCFCAARGT